MSDASSTYQGAPPPGMRYQQALHPFDESMRIELMKNFMTWSVNARSPWEELQALPIEELDTDFKREFPPDVFGHETDDTARVWKVYRAQSVAHDNTMLDGWNETINILLVFAGLFSAVVTAFLIESYKSLQFDNAAYIASALYTILSTDAPTALAHSLSPPGALQSSPTSSVRWINGLWFMSLFLALGVSLLSILMKQWLREYKARVDASSESPRDWARRRALLFRGLSDWRVAELISLLPVLIHVALFLFICGAGLFLWDLDRAIGISITVLGGVLGAFYAGSTLAPLWRPECPSSTPLVYLIRLSGVSVRITFLRTQAVIVRMICHLRVSLARSLHALQIRIQSSAVWTAFAYYRNAAVSAIAPYICCISRREPIMDPEDFGGPTSAWDNFGGRTSVWVWDTHSYISDSSRTAPRLSLEERITRIRQEAQDHAVLRSCLAMHTGSLDAEALKWLITAVSDTDAVAVALQALGDLQPLSNTAELLRGDTAVCEKLVPGALLTRVRGAPCPTELARMARSVIQMDRIPDGDKPLRDLLRVLDGMYFFNYPDFCILRASIQVRALTSYNIMSWKYIDPQDCKASPTCTKTCMTVLHRKGIDALCLLSLCNLQDVTDWDLILRAVSDDYAADHRRSLPQGFSPNITGAVRVCHVLARIYVQRKHNRYGSLEVHVPDLCHSVMAVMRCISDDTRPTWFNRHTDDPLNAYGPDCSNILAFLACSDGFLKWNTSDKDLAIAIRFVHHRAHLAVEEEAYEEARIALRTLASMLRWFGENKTSFCGQTALSSRDVPAVLGDHLEREMPGDFGWFSQIAYAVVLSVVAVGNRSTPEAAVVERLRLLLLPYDTSDGSATLWQIIATHTEYLPLISIATRIMRSLVVAQANQHPAHLALNDAFFRQVRFIDFVRPPTSGDLSTLNELRIVFDYWQLLRPLELHHDAYIAGMTGWTDFVSWFNA